MSDFEETRTLAGRRSFMKVAVAAGLGVAAANLLSPSAARAANGEPLPGAPTDGREQFRDVPGQNIDIKVLNFALTLEILEADLYRQALNAATGRSLGAALERNASAYRRRVGNGGLPDLNANDLFTFLVQFAYVEAAHRDFLRGVIPRLGGTPVPPNPGGYRFPGGPGGDIRRIMANILVLEETGVRAYLGAAPYLTDLNLIQTAGTIFSTEARHSGVISSQLLMPSGPNRMPGDLRVTPDYPSERTFEYFLKPATVLSRTRPFFA